MSHRSVHNHQLAPGGRAARGTAAGGRTFAPDGRKVRVGRIFLRVTIGGLVAMGVWSLATGTYFTFRDDVLTRLMARQADMQYAYEDRIAELRAEVDRLTSRQLLDQEQFDQRVVQFAHRVEQLARRQAALEARTSTLATLPDQTITGAVKAPGRGASSADHSLAPIPRLSPINHTVTDRDIPEEPVSSRETSRFESRYAGGLEGMLVRLGASLDRVEATQSAMLNALEESYDTTSRRLRSVLGELGISVGKVRPVSAGAAVGGPFVAASVRGNAIGFERQVQRIGLARAQLDRLTKTLVAVPLRKPLSGDIETTSGFGVRVDPFLRSPAMHTGLDFRGDTGDAVRATASGKVISAGWNGGYGKTVEIDHGNGFTTRYGHLSSIDVDEGDSVRVGQTIGRLGSTGRSTGPHLHYETRIDGDAVDPQKFLRAGMRLGGLY